MFPVQLDKGKKTQENIMIKNKQTNKQNENGMTASRVILQIINVNY